MSSVILTNWTVFYSDDAGAGNGYKQIRWTGGGGPEANSNTVNDLYSAVCDLFSISAQNNAHDTTPLRAVTPTVYEIGSFDAGDLEAWFIDPGSVQHLTGGSLQTVNWTRVVNADPNSGNPGIVRIPRTGSSIVAGDVGATITNTTSGDTGTLLYVETSYLWIRPTDCTSTHNWDSGGTTDLSCNGHTTDDQTGAAVSGERLWSNIYSIGTLEDNTNLVVYQNFSPLTVFWASGHIDRLFLVNDGYSTGLIDYGFLTVYARQYSKLYDHYLVDASGGGRNPIPLSTDDDVNNTVGYRTLTVAGSTGTWTAGNYIYRSTGGLTWSTTDTKGVITLVNGNDISYYLVGDYTDFVAGADDVQEYDPNTGANGDAAATSISAVANTTNGPTDTTPASITIVHGGASYDLDNGNGSRPYSVTINCQGCTLIQVYQRLKYLTRNGQTTDIDTGANQSHVGQQYTGVGDLYIPYDGSVPDNPFSESGGENITVTSPSFASVLTSKHDRGTNEGFIIVRNTRGTTPADNATLTGGTSGNTALVDLNSGADPIETVAVSKTAPFGTFAGGVFFGARGVYIYNMDAADANSYTLIDSEGTPQAPPTTYPISITVLDDENNPIEGAQVFIRKTADDYSYTSDTGNNAGDADFIVNETVDTDLPQTGWLHVWDRSSNTKQNYRYASWATRTFTLPTEVTGSATSGGTSTTLNSTGIGALDIQEGDTIRNTTDGSWAVVDELATNSAITTELTGGSDNTWQNSDAFSVHRLAIAYTDTDDLVDIPILNSQTNASGIASLTYAGSVPVSIIVRIRSNTGTPKYVPYNTTGTITSSGYSLTAILTQDSVAT